MFHARGLLRLRRSGGRGGGGRLFPLRPPLRHVFSLKRAFRWHGEWMGRALSCFVTERGDVQMGKLEVEIYSEGGSRRIKAPRLTP
ncbi:TPA: PaRep2a protein [Pyrobaculum aerophilum]|nr:PaRep2a protein [Pyrobaculum aerophilum]